jgi:hypothetical protein
MSRKSAPFTTVSTIGIDLGKSSFHLVGLVAVVEAQCLNPRNMGGTEFDKICEVIR